MKGGNGRITIHGQTISGDSITGIWHALVKLLLKAPPVAPRGIPCKELVGVTLRLSDSRRNILVNEIRKPRYRFMVAEWLWMWFSRDDVASIARYNSNISKFSDNGLTFHGAYGPRIGAMCRTQGMLLQWGRVVKLLKTDPDSRQAVIAIFQPRDTAVTTKDVPCTLNFQFFIRDKKLVLVATMRSSDVWLGLPYDVFNFTQLQACMAAELSLMPGEFVMNIGSSHIYQENWTAGKLATIVPIQRGPRSPIFTEIPDPHLEHVLDQKGYKGDVELLRPWATYAQVLDEPKNDHGLALLESLK